jgi:hypothetical protein
MGKCSPVAAEILSTWERVSLGGDIAGSEFVEFFMVARHRVPSNLPALVRDIELNRLLQILADGATGRPAAKHVYKKISEYAGTSDPREQAKRKPPNGPNGILWTMLLHASISSAQIHHRSPRSSPQIQGKCFAT